jgi:hypothetical protein
LLPGNGLLQGSRHAQLGVVVLPIARLRLDAAGPSRPAAVTVVIPVIAAPVRRHVGFLGLVNVHWTSLPPDGAKGKAWQWKRAFGIEDLIATS